MQTWLDLLRKNKYYSRDSLTDFKTWAKPCETRAPHGIIHPLSQRGRAKSEQKTADAHCKVILQDLRKVSVPSFRFIITRVLELEPKVTLPLSHTGHSSIIFICICLSLCLCLSICLLLDIYSKTMAQDLQTWYTLPSRRATDTFWHLEFLGHLGQEGPWTVSRCYSQNSLAYHIYAWYTPKLGQGTNSLLIFR